MVNLLQSLPFEDIARLELGVGEGDKRILREVAGLVGLSCCNNLVKRAVQFGTRIAKETNRIHFGSNRRGSGVTKIDK